MGRRTELRQRGTRHAPQSKADATRRRLLSAAAKAFADRGYEATSVRRVCRKATANVAAVSYHFGGKRGLYLEVLREGMRHTHGEDDAAMIAFAGDESLPREERLEGAVRAFARGVLRPKADWPVRLVLREMAQPTGALAQILEEFCDPRMAAIKQVVRAYLPAEDERVVVHHGLSIVAQVCYYLLVRPAALHFLGEQRYTEALADECVEHVVQFSRTALEAASAARTGRRAAR
jgi:AcrR family transcriptional regulator